MSASLRQRVVVAILGVALVMPTVAFGAAIPFSASGPNAASIQGEFTNFQNALGGVNNGNAAGPLATGRREINWDGGTATDGTPAVTPFTVFQNTRGGTFTTPGSGLTQTPINGGTVDIAPGVPGLQGSLTALNPTYATTFTTFSPFRLFAPLDSTITDGTFSIPGTGGTVPATVAGFGAVFTDVDLPNVTSIQYFGPNDAPLGTFFAPTANNGLSFLGVFFNAGEQISRIHITTGNSILGPTDGIVDTPNVDVVVMDDFIYAEPRVVPEPSTLALLLGGLLLLGWKGWLRCGCWVGLGRRILDH